MTDTVPLNFAMKVESCTVVSAAFIIGGHNDATDLNAQELKSAMDYRVWLLRGDFTADHIRVWSDALDQKVAIRLGRLPTWIACVEISATQIPQIADVPKRAHMVTEDIYNLWMRRIDRIHAAGAHEDDNDDDDDGYERRHRLSQQRREGDDIGRLFRGLLATMERLEFIKRMPTIPRVARDPFQFHRQYCKKLRRGAARRGSA